MNTLFFMMIASFLVSIMIMEFDLKNGIIFSLASIILGFIILNNKIQWILYSSIFSYYGVVKYFFESIKSLSLEYLFKYAFANMILFVVYNLLKNITFVPMSISLIFLYQALFLIYDKVYSSFIIYYRKNIKPKLKF